MYWTKTFIPTLKDTPQEAETIGHQLLLRSGSMRMLMAGVYSYLPLGLRVLENIQKIIRQELAVCGASELLLSALQPLELWQETGRDKDLGSVMFKFIDRRGRNVCLGPTHEEVITDLIRREVSSYRQLPLVLYQIQTKFRDEIRPRFGLIRTSEFIMKDAYSFDQDEAGLEKNYQLMLEAYKKIFIRCGLNILITEADSGVMGGKESHEFMVPAKEGEDLVLVCKTCNQAYPHTAEKEAGVNLCAKCGAEMNKVSTIEVGHIFKLGVKYSQALGANFLNAEGKLQPIIMGCYGIGVSRLISAIVEQNNDAGGIIWPKGISPYQILILPLDVSNSQLMSEAVKLYQELSQAGLEVLLDDRDARAGVKFKDADLLGVPLQVVMGKTGLLEGTVELKIRSTGEKIIIPRQQAIPEIVKRSII